MALLPSTLALSLPPRWGCSATSSNALTGPRCDCSVTRLLYLPRCHRRTLRVFEPKRVHLCGRIGRGSSPGNRATTNNIMHVHLRSCARNVSSSLQPPPSGRPRSHQSFNRWERSHSTSPRSSVGPRRRFGLAFSEVVCVRELDGNTSPEAVQSRPPLTPPTLFDFSSVRLRTRRLRCPVDAAKNAISSRGLVERWPAPIHKQFVQRRLLPYHRPSHPLMLVGKDPPTGYAVVTAMCPSRRVLQHRRHPSTVQAGPRATAARCAQTLADGVA